MQYPDSDETTVTSSESAVERTRPFARDSGNHGQVAPFIVSTVSVPALTHPTSAVDSTPTVRINNTFNISPALFNQLKENMMQHDHLLISTPPPTPEDPSRTPGHHPETAPPLQRKLAFNCWPVEVRQGVETPSDVHGGQHDDQSRAYCYDIDLDTPGISPLPPRECPEADCLTPTLPPGGLGPYRVTVDGAELLTQGTRQPVENLFTCLKSRPSDQSIHSDTTPEDVSDPSSDAWDADVDLTHCVRYQDVHMARPSASAATSAASSLTPLTTPSVKTEQLEEECSGGSSSQKTDRQQIQRKELKRPKNGFIRFAMEYRKQVAQDHPRLDNRDISRILGIRWRKLMHEERAEYEAAFHKEMMARKTAHPEWRYGGSRHHDDTITWEPIPTRLRPRDTLKRRKIPRLTRPYNRRQAAVIRTTWVQCDRCNKWRQLPHGADMDSIPARWYCEYNWAPKNHCDAEEDQEDAEETLLTQQFEASLTEHHEEQGQRGGYGLNDFVYF